MSQDTFTAHAALAAPAWSVILPFGAILIRVIPSKKAWIIHAGVMLFGLSVFTSGFAAGLWGLLHDGYRVGHQGHTIFGTIIFAIAWTQPISGLIHHLIFEKVDRRTLFSTLHVFLGRIMITSGMINGGIGLLLANNSTYAENVSYGTIVGVLWVTYFAFSLFDEAKRDNELRDKAHHVGKTENLVESDSN